MAGFAKLREEIIDTGLCTDCGTCVAVCPNNAIVMNYQTEEPELKGKCATRCQLCHDICPGKDISLPELNQVAFGREPNEKESLLGVAQDYLRAHAVDDEVREAGAAGGVISALLIYALEKGIIDTAVVTGMSDTQNWRVVPKIARSRADVIANAQSKYAMAPTNSIIKEALASGKKLGAVGLPCHVHGLRKIQAARRPRQINNAIQFIIGLFCASNTNYRATEHMIEELLGIPLEQVTKVEFRGGKYPGHFQVTTRDNKLVVLTAMSGMMGIAGFYRDRCQMCYDYPSELADISVGDYFHPDMKSGAQGWSVIVVRSDIGKKIVAGARAANYLHAEPVEVNYLLGAGWELKRHGAAFRLLERRRHHWPTPDYHVPLDYPRPMFRVVDSVPPYAKVGRE